jgi:hypothetical protein
VHVTLGTADAMELEQLLDLLTRWMRSERACLAPSLARFLLRHRPPRLRGQRARDQTR